MLDLRKANFITTGLIPFIKEKKLDSEKIDSIKETLEDIKTSISIFQKMQIEERDSPNAHSFLYGAARQTIKSIEESVDEALDSLKGND